MDRRTVLTTLGTSAFAAAAPVRLGAQALAKITVAGVATEDSTNMYYGLKNGIFRRHGLDLDWTITASGTAATTAAIAGTYNIAKASNLVVFTAHLRGVPIVMVAPAFEYNEENTTRNPFLALQIPSDSPIKTASDLNGKTIGVAALGDVTQLMVAAWADKNGGDWRSLKFVEIPGQAMVQALVQQRVAAGILLQPLLDLSLAEKTTRTVGLVAAGIAPAYTPGAYVALADWADRNGAALREFNRALIESSTYVNAHLAETAPLVAEFTKLDLSAVTKMHRTLTPTRLNASLIQPLIDAAYKYNLTPRAFPAREVLWSGLS